MFQQNIHGFHDIKLKTLYLNMVHGNISIEKGGVTKTIQDQTHESMYMHNIMGRMFEPGLRRREKM